MGGLDPTRSLIELFLGVRRLCVALGRWVKTIRFPRTLTAIAVRIPGRLLSLLNQLGDVSELSTALLEGNIHSERFTPLACFEPCPDEGVTLDRRRQLGLRQPAP